jgi:hypothetical protein
VCHVRQPHLLRPPNAQTNTTTMGSCCKSMGSTSEFSTAGGVERLRKQRFGGLSYRCSLVDLFGSSGCDEHDLSAGRRKRRNTHGASTYRQGPNLAAARAIGESMDVEEMKKLLKAVDELEAQFAKQKADYEAKKEALQAALYRMGRK